MTTAVGGGARAQAAWLFGVSALAWLVLVAMHLPAGWQAPLPATMRVVLEELCGRGAVDAGGWPALLPMWAAMVLAMMLPGAWPLVRAHATLPRRGGVVPSTAWLVLGYLAVWMAFSAIAALGQHALASLALVDAEGASTSRALDAALLVLAGLYQWSPLKHACVRRCRSPMRFLLAHWRDGRGGSLLLGARHGLDCLGCCVALMLLGFVGGVADLAWMAVAAVLMAIEKTPAGERLTRPLGWVLLAAGAWHCGRLLAGD